MYDFQPKQKKYKCVIWQLPIYYININGLHTSIAQYSNCFKTKNANLNGSQYKIHPSELLFFLSFWGTCESQFPSY